MPLYPLGVDNPVLQYLKSFHRFLQIAYAPLTPSLERWEPSQRMPLVLRQKLWVVLSPVGFYLASRTDCMLRFWRRTDVWIAQFTGNIHNLFRNVYCNFLNFRTTFLMSVLKCCFFFLFSTPKVKSVGLFTLFQTKMNFLSVPLLFDKIESATKLGIL